MLNAIPPEHAARMQQVGALPVDVREPAEYASAAIPGAANLPRLFAGLIPAVAACALARSLGWTP